PALGVSGKGKNRLVWVVTRAGLPRNGHRLPSGVQRGEGRPRCLLPPFEAGFVHPRTGRRAAIVGRELDGRPPSSPPSCHRPRTCTSPHPCGRADGNTP